MRPPTALLVRTSRFHSPFNSQHQAVDPAADSEQRDTITALEQPFVVTVRARGLGELRLRLRHVLRHAALPVVTLGGWIIGGLLGGAVITEKVFGRPGLGTVTLNAVLSQDAPVVLAVVLLAAFIHVAASTLLDLLYALIDPRLKAS